MLGELSQSSTHSSLRVGGARRSRFNFVNLYPVCLRVRPLLARLGDDEIVADFQKILDPLRYGAERTHGGIGGLGNRAPYVLRTKRAQAQSGHTDPLTIYKNPHLNFSHC